MGKYETVEANDVDYVYQDTAWFENDEGREQAVVVRVFQTGDFHVEFGNAELYEGFYGLEYKTIDDVIDTAWEVAFDQAQDEGYFFAGHKI